MIDIILSDYGELVIFILGAIAAALSFIAYGRVQGKYVPIKRIYLVSWGVLSASISIVFYSVYSHGRERAFVAINWIVISIMLILVIVIAINIIWIKHDIDKRT